MAKKKKNLIQGPGLKTHSIPVKTRKEEDRLWKARGSRKRGGSPSVTEILGRVFRAAEERDRK